MRVYLFIGLLCAINVESQFWDNDFLPKWFREAKSTNNQELTNSSVISDTMKIATATMNNESTTVRSLKITDTPTIRIENKSTTGIPKANGVGTPTKVRNIIPISTTPVPTMTEKITTILTTSTINEGSTIYDTTNLEIVTTEESRDISRTHEFYLSKRAKPPIKISTNISQVRSYLL